ncbi:uncharacterized protein K452DRAFT_65080 [Aplosporella prunicola CBS 121167]|uniref:Uncharacterized protein n=1 Tax=Aplosporella prunicola CBS 121167 TaxID=1176127 RepID=A0A6A6B6J2_9PEZI|nr:uncharacterized protein K452DRAFT_65080 [Aplosporella prunicola CBS 121167]KAF2139752.1 hypothetical protein K452DRAFT_65080 [Aplosporella prunicola CBS 121167]
MPRIQVNIVRPSTRPKQKGAQRTTAAQRLAITRPNHVGDVPITIRKPQHAAIIPEVADATSKRKTLVTPHDDLSHPSKFVAITPIDNHPIISPAVVEDTEDLSMVVEEMRASNVMFERARGIATVENDDQSIVTPVAANRDPPSSETRDDASSPYRVLLAWLPARVLGMDEKVLEHTQSPHILPGSLLPLCTGITISQDGESCITVTDVVYMGLSTSSLMDLIRADGRPHVGIPDTTLFFDPLPLFEHRDNYKKRDLLQSGILEQQVPNNSIADLNRRLYTAYSSTGTSTTLRDRDACIGFICQALLNSSAYKFLLFLRPSCLRSLLYSI